MSFLEGEGKFCWLARIYTPTYIHIIFSVVVLERPWFLHGGQDPEVQECARAHKEDFRRLFVER